LAEFLENFSARKLREETGIWCGTIYAIKDWHKNKKYTKHTLDTLYEFFNLEKDLFYTENLKIHYQNENPFWILFKTRREKLWFTKHEVAKKIKWTERHLTRIESWDSSYRINSYYLKELIVLYNFDQGQANQIMSYVLSLGDIIDLTKQENTNNVLD